MNMANILIITVRLNCTCDIGPRNEGICGLLEMRVSVFKASSSYQLSCNLDAT